MTFIVITGGIMASLYITTPLHEIPTSDSIINMGIADRKLIINYTADNFQDVKVKGFVPDVDLLNEIFRVLKTNGKLTIENCIESREMGQEISLELKISGFVDVMSVKGL